MGESNIPLDILFYVVIKKKFSLFALLCACVFVSITISMRKCISAPKPIFRVGIITIFVPFLFPFPWPFHLFSWCTRILFMSKNKSYHFIAMQLGDITHEKF